MSVQQLPGPIVTSCDSAQTRPSPGWPRGKLVGNNYSDYRLLLHTALTALSALSASLTAIQHSIILSLSIDTRLFLQVLVPSAGIRGFLDASEFGTWLKFVRTNREKHNMKHVLLGGQIFYETVREVGAHQELCLEEKPPIQLDSGEELKQEDDVKSISQDEEDLAEYDESGVKCLVCDKSFPDVYM